MSPSGAVWRPPSRRWRVPPRLPAPCRRAVERLLRQETRGGDRLITPQIVARQPRLFGGLVARRLGRFDQVVVGRQLRLGLAELALLFGQRQSEWRRIDPGEQSSLGHALVVDDRHGDDPPGDLRRDRDEIGGHVGVVGIGEDIARPPIEAECRRQGHQHQDHPPPIACRGCGFRVEDHLIRDRAQHRRRGSGQPRLNGGAPIA